MRGTDAAKGRSREVVVPLFAFFAFARFRPSGSAVSRDFQRLHSLGWRRCQQGVDLHYCMSLRCMKTTNHGSKTNAINVEQNRFFVAAVPAHAGPLDPAASLARFIFLDRAYHAVRCFFAPTHRGTPWLALFFGRAALRRVDHTRSSFFRLRKTPPFSSHQNGRPRSHVRPRGGRRLLPLARGEWAE